MSTDTDLSSPKWNEEQFPEYLSRIRYWQLSIHRAPGRRMEPAGLCFCTWNINNIVLIELSDKFCSSLGEGGGKAKQNR